MQSPRHWICKPRTQTQPYTNHASESCVRAHGGRLLWRRSRRYFLLLSPPSAVDPLPGQALERGHVLLGVSKQRWHVDVLARCSALGSPPPHRTPLPEKQLRLFSFPSSNFFSFSLFFFLKKILSLSLLPPPKRSVFASENRVTVCFTGCSIPQVYPDLKIPIKWRAGARYLEWRSC